MTEKGILFNGDAVRAILAGRKTQTRRVVQPQPFPSQSIRRLVTTWCGYPRDCGWWLYGRNGDLSPWIYEVTSQYQPGDLLYIRETWQVYHPEWVEDACLEPGDPFDEIPQDEPLELHWVAYQATDTSIIGPWRPSIHMPHWAARPVRLLVTDVWAQRVQDMDWMDALAEGVSTACIDEHQAHCYDEIMARFEHAWDAIYAKRGLSWDANPWVWVYEFEVQNADDA